MPKIKSKKVPDSFRLPENIRFKSIDKLSKSTIEYFSVSELIALIDHEIIEVPEIQRKFESWDYSDILNLVESILLNMYTPQIYFHRKNDGKLEIIDGQHRIYSLYYFFNLKEIFKRTNIGDKILGIEKKKGHTFDDFIFLATYGYVFQKINVDSNLICVDNIGSENIRTILNFRMQAVILENNQASANYVFVILNSTGEPLVNGEVIRARLFEYLPKDDVKIFLNKLLSISKIWGEKRYKFIIPYLTPYVLTLFAEPEITSFKSVLNIESVIRNKLLSLEKSEVQKMVSSYSTLIEKIESNNDFNKEFKKITKISTLYGFLFYLFQNSKYINDSNAADFALIISEWEKLIDNDEIKKKYLSRSPIALIQANNFIKERINDKERDGIEIIKTASSSDEAE